MMPRVPHLRVVVVFSLIAVLGYAVFSVWIYAFTGDAALKGDVVGTWKSFAVLAFGFWIGSSSAGKAKESEPPHETPTPVSTARTPLPTPSFGAKPDMSDTTEG